MGNGDKNTSIRLTLDLRNRIGSALGAELDCLREVLVGMAERKRFDVKLRLPLPALPWQCRYIVPPTSRPNGLRFFDFFPTFPTYLGLQFLLMPKFPTFPDCFDECKQVTITGLKRLRCLRPDAIVGGSYSWTRGGKPSGCISISTNLPDRYIELDYNYGDKPIRYRVRLESIPKHFGGCEWYFICPATGKRCRTLYGIGEYFLSRFEYPSAMYSEQTKSKHWRGFSKFFRYVDLETDYRSKRHARKTYKGKLTKRYRRLLEKESRFDPNALLQFLKGITQ